MHIIHNWYELEQYIKLNPPKYGNTIEVDTNKGTAFINKDKSIDDWFYLSTHTFYNSYNANIATQQLNEIGLDVVLQPWD